MPRYFFHIDNGEFIPDQTGTELPDLAAARREAVRAAGEMIDDSQQSFWEHRTQWNMHVTDSDRRLLFTLQFGAKIPSGASTIAFVDHVAVKELCSHQRSSLAYDAGRCRNLARMDHKCRTPFG